MKWRINQTKEPIRVWKKKNKIKNYDNTNAYVVVNDKSAVLKWVQSAKRLGNC